MPYNTKAPAVILQSKSMFARHGVPEHHGVPDNVPPYNSFEHADFAKLYNFSIKISSPEYPQSNGKVESAVKAAKQILLKDSDQ